LRVLSFGEAGQKNEAEQCYHLENSHAVMIEVERIFARRPDYGSSKAYAHTNSLTGRKLNNRFRALFQDSLYEDVFSQSERYRAQMVHC
jgi:hypothetical protein